MIKPLSAFAFLCVCWALQDPSGTGPASREMPETSPEDAAKFTITAPDEYLKVGMTSFAGNSPFTFPHLPTANVHHQSLLPFSTKQKKDTADSIAVSRESVTFSEIGAAITLTATVFDAKGAILDDAPLVWIVANPAVATVDQNGVVTSVDNGSTRIAITAGTVTVRISVLVESNEINPESERKVLVTFYEAIDGENWDQNTNWQSEHPLNEWYGVRTDEKGSVTELRLMDNDLAGPIPPELGSLSALVRLELSGNQLSGSLPAALGTLEDLEVLNLSENDLAGELPERIGDLSSLITLDVSANAQLTGALPVTLPRLDALDEFRYDGTELCVPEVTAVENWLAGLSVHRGTGQLCAPIADREVLEDLYAALGGAQWANADNWNTNTPLEEWQGITLDGQGRVSRLDLRGQGLNGALPSGIASLTYLTHLTLDDNNLEGPIPPPLGTLENLVHLRAHSAALTGSLPGELGNLENLEQLDLSDNDLAGAIPAAWGNLGSLNELSLKVNRLSGPLPSELGRLSELHTLSIADNQGLSGEVPASFVNLEALRVFHADGTGVCLPANPSLQSWNDGLTTSSLPLCAPPAEPALELSVSNLSVTEGGTETYTVRLASEPTGTVTVAITGHATTNLQLDKTSLTFTAATWNVAQTVTLTADPDVNTISETIPLVHAASGADYGNVQATVIVTVTDDDTPALELSVSNLSATEGDTETYTVQLASEPTGTVTIAITGHAGTALKLDKPSLTFDPAIWNIAQTVTLTADPDVNAISETIPLVHTASGADYANVQTTLIVTVADRDAATLNLSASALPVDEGSSTTYNLRLSSRPAGTVTVAITGHAGTSLKLDKTALTFTRETWNIAQTVTVTAGPDANATSEIISLLHAASGANYEAVQATVVVTVADRDAATLNLSTSALSVTEESSNTYTLRLASEPAGTVTVAITGHAGTALKLDKASLTFTQVIWNVAQTVTVTADPDANAVNETIPLVHAASGANYENVRAELTVTVTDDDPAGVLIVSPGSISIPEGSQNTYTVRLSSEPAGTVTVATTGHEGTDLKPDKTSLTFTAATWNAARTVTVSAEHDLDADEDHATLLHTASGADYAGMTAKVEVTVKDDDAPGTLVFSSETLSVIEGSRNTYTVQLSRAPTAAVTADIIGFANTDLTLDKTSLTFTPTTWNQSQTVTVTAGPDDDATNDTATLIHTTSGANYDGISGNVAVTIEDADTPALEVSVSNLTIDEGNSSNYTVRLATKPATEVLVGITGFANTDLMLDKTSLTFTAMNWNQDQTITVSANQDLDGTDDTATLAHTASGADYGGETGSVAVTVNDDDVPGVLTFSSTGVSVPEGDRNTYTVQLSGAPTAAVTVDITGHTGTALTLDKTSLTFTPTDWNRNQTVTVTARPDDDGRNESATLVHTASGANYGGVSGNVAVTIIDDDTPELDLSASSLTINEGDSKGYTVRLTTKPATDVTVTITGHAGTDLSLDKESLTFTAATWNQNQTVTVSADDDPDFDNDTATLLHTASGDDYGNVTANISVIVMDDDTGEIVLTPPTLEINEGQSNGYKIRLSTAPPGIVTVVITGHASMDLTLDKTSLEFTSETWNTDQTVNVTAEQDLDDTNDTETLVHTASGTGYGDVTGNVAVTVNDDDAPALDISVSGLEIPEGGSKSYTIQLATQPAADVIVNIRLDSSRNTDIKLSTKRLRFSKEDWNVPQTVKVTAGQDPDWTTDSERLRHIARGGSYRHVIGDVTISVADDEVMPAPPHVYVFQSVQSFFNSVPLIAGDPAFLRIFPKANTPTSTPLPKAVATFYLNDTVEHTANIAGKSGPIPTEIWAQDLQMSLNADIPASVIQPGLEMVVEVDPDDTVPDHLGVVKRIPATGRMSLNVVTVPTLNITFVPLVTTGHAGGDNIIPVVQRLASNPNTNSDLYNVRTLLPIKDISATAHATVTVNTSLSTRLINRVAVIRKIENGSGYWMGLHHDIEGVRGRAYIGGVISISEAYPRTIAHELGHNLSLKHAPCPANVSSPDANYPYAGGVIGSWGYENNSMNAPVDYYDLMTWSNRSCIPVWISDYNFNKALDHYQYQSKSSVGEASPLVSASTPSEISLLIWGGTDAASKPYLEPIFEVDTRPALPQEPGPWQLAGHSASGDMLFRLIFAMPVIADGDGSSSFAFVVSLQQEQAQLLSSVTLSGPDGSYTIDKEYNTPMAIVMDQTSGQVTGFLDNYDPLNDPRITAISNKVGGGTQRVLFSRGIPNLGAQD